MASRLLHGARMTTLCLLATLLTAQVAAGAAADTQDAPLQAGASIESAEVSGLPMDQLSRELRQDIEALAGTRLDVTRINALAVRIETEHPDAVAAVRHVERPDGRIRIVFLVARISDDASLSSNINARYPIERVEIRGIDESRLSQELRDQLHA